MQRFAGKRAVITGAASGIGAATTRRLASEGARVLLADIDESLGKALAEEIGGAFQRTDVADEAALAALFERAAREFDGLDILVNNAGVGGSGIPTPDLDPVIWRRVMAINLDSVFHGCRLAIPLMRQGGGGAIVNTASISGLGGDYSFTAYNASKAAVINYTRALALDHSREGIRVNAVCPGLIDTALTASLEAMPALLAEWKACIPLGRSGTADEIASAIAFLASDEASYVTGSILVADGGITAGTGQPNIPAFLAGR